MAAGAAHTSVARAPVDLYVSRQSRRGRCVPTSNQNRADTLASMDRVERIVVEHIVARTPARLVIQHDPSDFAALPKPPLYLR